MFTAASEAADLLETEGVSCSVWDPRVVKPLDPVMISDAVPSSPGGHHRRWPSGRGYRTGYPRPDLRLGPHTCGRAGNPHRPHPARKGGPHPVRLRARPVRDYCDRKQAPLGQILYSACWGVGFLLPEPLRVLEGPEYGIRDDERSCSYEKTIGSAFFGVGFDYQCLRRRWGFDNRGHHGSDCRRSHHCCY